MKSSCKFLTRANGPGLELSTYFDNCLIENLCVGLDWQTVEFEFNDEQDQHCLEIRMTGKLPEHTQLDQNNRIIEDLLCEIKDFELDGVQLGNILYQHTKYTHDHNGSTDIVEQDFYGSMGCNGSLKFTFVSPVYQWVLEHL